MGDNNIKYIREELEMTQKEFGLVFGVSRKTVAGWEDNHDSIPLKKLVKMANLYKYSADYITGLSRENTYIELPALNKKKIGTKLKEVRSKLNLTQQQVADICKISQSTYSNYEKGLYLPYTLVLYSICYKYNLSIDDILK